MSTLKSTLKTLENIIRSHHHFESLKKNLVTPDKQSLLKYVTEDEIGKARQAIEAISVGGALMMKPPSAWETLQDLTIQLHVMEELSKSDYLDIIRTVVGCAYTARTKNPDTKHVMTDPVKIECQLLLENPWFFTLILLELLPYDML